MIMKFIRTGGQKTMEGIGVDISRALKEPSPVVYLICCPESREFL